MTINEYIQAIAAEAFPGSSFFYGRNTDFNINGDNAVSPAVVAIFPDTFSFAISPLSGNVSDGYNMFIRFIEKLDNIGEQAANYYNDAIERQKVNAAIFIAELSKDDNFIDLQNPIQAIPVIEAYDSNWFGVEINIKHLQTIQPLDVCAL